MTPHKLITTEKTINTRDKLESINNNNYPVTTNQENNKLPEFLNSEKNNKIGIIRRTKSKYIKNFKSNSFIINLNTQKFNFDINDCIFDSDNINIDNVFSFTKKVLQMKIFQGIQKNNLDFFLDKNFDKVKKYINHVETNFEKFKNICKIYVYKHLKYLKFLKKKVIEINEENILLNKKKVNLGFEIDDIINKNIKKQNELEKLINLRNFIYKVRHRDEQIPNIYSTFYYESKRYLLAKLFIKLFPNINHISVIKYLSNIPKDIPDLNTINKSEFYVEQCPPLIRNKNNNSVNLNNENNKIEDINNKNIFHSHYEFISVMKFLERQNLELLKENEKIKELIEKNKNKLKNSKSPLLIEFEENNKRKIEMKEKELNMAKTKNLKLIEEYKYFNEAFSNRDLFYNNKVSTKIGNEIKSTFQDLEYYQTINYNTLIKKAKYSGLIFFRKLLKYYLTLIKLKENLTIYKETHPDYLKVIVNFSKNAEQNPRYSYFINRYILKILQLYEYVCNYIYKKYQLDKLDKKNLVIINKELDIISYIKKADNIRGIRKSIEKKRYESFIKLIEKWKMPPKYIGKKNYIGTYCRDLVKGKNKKKLFKKRKTVKTQVKNDNDFEDFLCYI